MWKYIPISREEVHALRDLPILNQKCVHDRLVVVSTRHALADFVHENVAFAPPSSFEAATEKTREWMMRFFFLVTLEPALEQFVGWGMQTAS